MPRSTPRTYLLEAEKALRKAHDDLNAARADLQEARTHIVCTDNDNVVLRDIIKRLRAERSNESADNSVAGMLKRALRLLEG